MNKKTKLVLVISSFCFVLTTCLFSVFAAKSFSFNMGGSVEFVAPGIEATVSAASLTGISKKAESGQMSSFTVTRNLTESQISALAGVQSWSGIQLLFTDDSNGQASISFTIKNNSSKQTEYIMAKLSSNTTSSSAIQATPSADYCIAPGETHSFTINLSVSNPDISATLSDFALKVELKALKASEVLSVSEQQSTNNLTLSTNSDTKTAAFTKYSGTATSVEIPSVVKDANDNLYTVTEIPDSSTESESPFYSVRSTLTSITLPSTLTKIGDYAFKSCNKISGNLIIPNSVKTIGNYAFAYCDGLTGDLVIPNGVETIGDSAFRFCDGLTGNLIIGDSVKTIGGYAFKESAFRGTVTIGNSVETIGEAAFRECFSLSGVIFGSSVKTIGNSAFSYCSGLKNALILPNTLTTIGEQAFWSCSSLTGDLIIPESVTTIGEAAFKSCSGLTGDVIIPDGITTIGSQTFEYCMGLTGVTIPSSITTIGAFAFFGCKGFTGDLIIPSSVTTIDRNAFFQCTGLTSLSLKSTTPPTLGATCFDSTNDCPIYVPSGSVDEYKAATNWSTYSDRIFAIS